MKKIHLLSLGLCIFFTGLVSAQPKNDLEKMGIKGNVKEQTKLVYEIRERFGKPDKTLFEKEVTKFNKDGNITESVIYNSKNRMKSKYVHSYDDRVKKEIDMYNAKGALIYKSIFRYNDKGDLIEESGYHSDGSVKNKVLVEYNAAGQKTKEKWYNSNGSLIWTKVFQYDEKGNLTEDITYTKDDKFFSKNNYVYDGKGNKVKWIYSTDSPVGFMIVYKRNKKENHVEALQYNAEEVLTGKLIYKYNDKGNLSEEEEYDYVDKFGKKKYEPVKVTEYKY